MNSLKTGWLTSLCRSEHFSIFLRRVCRSSLNVDSVRDKYNLGSIKIVVLLPLQCIFYVKKNFIKDEIVGLLFNFS